MSHRLIETEVVWGESVFSYRKRVPEETLPDLLQRLYEEQYTGSITFHWINGVPKKVEFPGDQIKLVTGGSLSD